LHCVDRAWQVLCGRIADEDRMRQAPFRRREEFETWWSGVQIPSVRLPLVGALIFMFT
jgi:hypothetical protein